MSPISSSTSYLIGNDGAIVHSWIGNGPAAQAVYLLPNSHILRTGVVPSPAFSAAAGTGGRIDEFTWDGALVWTYTLSNDKYLRHHDIAPLPNGNVLVEAFEMHTRDEAIAAGRDPNRIAGPTFYSEAVFEIRPTRPSGGEVVWEWHVWDHLVQDFDSSKQNYGDVAAHAELMDLNFSLQTPDWLHFNAIAYNPDLDQIAVSSRTIGEIWIVDHSTTTAEAATHLGGLRARGGDILYRWGNPQTYRAGTAADQRLFDQHGVNWIASGLPGAGHLLVFNNGNARGYSSADEIVTPVDERGFYTRAEGTRFGPEKAIWSYGEQAQPHFLSSIFGGAQRLPNGNTLICISTAFRTIEVTPESEVVWEANIQDLAGPNGGGSFRASRFPPNYEALRGTDLFREGPALVNAASMIGGPSSPGGMVEAHGTGLPAALAGTTVEVTDGSGSKLSAPLISVSPDEVYFEVPSGAAIGPARLTIHGNGTTDQSAEIRIDPIAPGLFSANGDGQGVGAIAAVHVNQRGQSTELVFSLDPTSRRFVLKPLSLGGADEQVFLQLYGTGMRGALNVLIGGVSIPVVSAESQPLILGLDEVVIGPLPRILAGRGVQPISIAIDSAVSNSVTIWIQ